MFANNSETNCDCKGFHDLFSEHVGEEAQESRTMIKASPAVKHHQRMLPEGELKSEGEIVPPKASEAKWTVGDH